MVRDRQPFTARAVAGLRRIIERPATVSLTRYERLLPAIAKREATVRELSDIELRTAAQQLREVSFDTGRLVELGALGREAARRALDERAFDTQLLGAMGMIDGRVVEMATGEGKTLVGALAACGHVLQGRQVHVMSVNDYLARRDAEWMRPVFDLLGVSVDWVDPSKTAAQRRLAYSADVTYGSVSEIGFDVLRDRLVTDPDDLVLTAPAVAIVDEADSVLVDEARVPLVLAGAVDAGAADERVAEIVRRLEPGVHYETDADRRNAWLTSAGETAVERALRVDLYSESGASKLGAVNIALHAQALLTRDVDYLVRDGKIALINHSRGRVAELQRWPDGLQAAVEVKEQLEPSDNGRILDSITVQAVVARYPSVAGMTGTAVAVAEALREFYRLEVAVIAPNTANIRDDGPDRIFATAASKQRAVLAEIERVHREGRPILVGTPDVAESEDLAMDLAKAGLPCTVLNARNDAEEAAIIAEAGRFGAITVSTQMAGRGTDIKLGGTTDTAARAKVVELGGLHVIGTAHYPSSRLDDQLRGRAGRQGDPGTSQFFASLADEVIRVGGPELPSRLRTVEDGEIDDPAATRHHDHAQRVVEGAHLATHRNTWRYTQLIDRQRADLLTWRDELLHTDAAARLLEAQAPQRYVELSASIPADELQALCREIVLFELDLQWSQHLEFLAEVRESIHLRALGRQTPIDEFHRAATPEFHKLAEAVTARSVESFTELDSSAGVDLDSAGVHRPSSTWTYLVQDNPFDFDTSRTFDSVLGLLARRAR